MLVLQLKSAGFEFHRSSIPAGNNHRAHVHVRSRVEAVQSNFKSRGGMSLSCSRLYMCMLTRGPPVPLA
jgi:hypothetical protein